MAPGLIEYQPSMRAGSEGGTATKVLCRRIRGSVAYRAGDIG
jgi:hypothetical protein